MTVMVPPSILGNVQRALEERMFNSVSIYGPDPDGGYTDFLMGFTGRLQFRNSDESNGTGNQLGSVDVASAWLYYPLSVNLPTGAWQAVVGTSGGDFRFSNRQNSRGESSVDGTTFQQYVELQFVGAQL